MSALVKALSILNSVARTPEPIAVSEIARNLGFNRSLVSKILRVFDQSALLAQNQTTKKYSPGVASFALGTKYIQHLEVARIGAPILRQAVDATGHSAAIGIMHVESVLHVLALEGRTSLDFRLRVGESLPVHASSAGRVLLAFQPAGVADELLASKRLVRFTPRTCCDVGAFKRSLRQVKTTGFSISRGERIPGLAAVAVPVFGQGNCIACSFAMIFPDESISKEHEPRLVNELHGFAQLLSARLGAAVYPFGDGMQIRRSRIGSESTFNSRR